MSKKIVIAQGNNDVWYILSEDGERLLSRHSTARDAASQAIYDRLDASQRLVLEIVPKDAEAQS